MCAIKTDGASNRVGSLRGGVRSTGMTISPGRRPREAGGGWIRRCCGERVIGVCGLERNFEWEEAQSAAPTGHVPPPFFDYNGGFDFGFSFPAPRHSSRRGGPSEEVLPTTSDRRESRVNPVQTLEGPGIRVRQIVELALEFAFGRAVLRLRLGFRPSGSKRRLSCGTRCAGGRAKCAIARAPAWMGA